MRIGFSSLYSWRPHVEHLHYLAGLVRDAGHEVAFLTCDADLPACYNRALKPHRNGWAECTKCRAGGIRSFTGQGVASIGQFAGGPVPAPGLAREWARSSASTLGRFESDADFESPEFHALVDRLEPAVSVAYAAARRWIEREQLDAVCLFNGRMDATRAILEACRDAGIRCATVERTWFGDGLQILPDENCLGLRAVDTMMARWKDTPLTHEQARLSIGHVASRFLRTNSKEWRAYNVAAKTTPWPVPGGRRRLLLVPGSRNEVWGHSDWLPHWPSRTDAFEAVIRHLGLSAADVLLRCHPNWGERIGVESGVRSERHYTAWAQAQGIHVIGSTDTTSTLGLIEQADAVVVCGGSAALEAGILGKQVIAVTPSVYQRAGFQSSAYSPQQLQELRFNCELSEADQTRERARIARQTLRFCYTMVHRIPQFVPQVHCITTTRYEYREGADPQRLIRLLRSGELEPDDPHAANDAAAEDAVLALVARRAWGELLAAPTAASDAPRRDVSRRWMFRAIDRVRDAMPRGDL